MKNTTEEVLKDLANLAKQDSKIRADKGLSLVSRGAIVYDHTSQNTNEVVFDCASETGMASAYDVKIKYSGVRIASYCTCLDFAQGHVCKHIRAAAYFATKNTEAVSLLLKLKIAASEKDAALKKNKPIKKVEVVVPTIEVNNEFREFRFYNLSNFYTFIHRLPTNVELELARSFDKHLHILTATQGHLELKLVLSKKL